MSIGKKTRNAFTIIELMVVILIVAILAAVAVPIYWGRMDSAKWSEGKAMMGTIASAIRVYHTNAGHSGAPPANLWIGDPCNLGFYSGDLQGTYFSNDCFSFEVTSMDPLIFAVIARHPTLNPQEYTLNQDGIFTELP